MPDRPLPSARNSTPTPATVDEAIDLLVAAGILVVDWNGNCYGLPLPNPAPSPTVLVRGLVRSNNSKNREKTE